MLIGQTISHYKILEKLGEGGMGIVYKAEDTKLKRTVALKFPSHHSLASLDLRTRFFHEARAAAALRHAGICTIHEIDEADGNVFIAMEYIEGRSLREKIASDPMLLEEAVDIAVQVAAALGEAHEKGILHRDIKPENIMVTEKGQAVVMDFGLAKLVKGTEITAAGTLLGTAAYMSPEQVQGTEVDHRTDIWSLGVLLYEMVAGRAPFQGERAHTLMYLIVNQEPEPLGTARPGVPPELERAVMKMLAKRPEDRYQSAAEPVADLKNLQSGIATSVKRRTSLKRFAIPGVLVVLAIILFFVLNPFKARIAPDRGADAGENILAVMYFENLAQEGDPQRLGEIITNLLITNLSQSLDLKVVSSQRLYDILKLQGKEGIKIIDRSTATAIATKAGARWMMLGSILQVEPHLVVTSQLVDVATGNIEASQQMKGAPGETVFDLVDKMTGATRTELAVPVRLDVELPSSVVNVTTNSLDAYRYYLEGLEYRYKYYMEEACMSFRKAIELDSTFAMAYYWYSRSALLTSSEKDAMASLDKAVEYAGRASEKERLYIEAQKALTEFRFGDALAALTKITERYPDEKDAFLQMAGIYMDWDNEKSLKYYQRVLAIDPLDKRTYNSLAFLYDRLGDFRKSMWAINKYIELAPGEASPYDSRADLCAYNGDIDNAIASYQKALEIKPDFLYSMCKLGHMYLFKGQYSKAEAQYKKLIASDLAAVRSRGRLYPSCILLYQGKLREALKSINIGIAADEMENYYSDWHPDKYYQRGSIYSHLKQNDRAVEEFRHALDLSKSLYRHLDMWEIPYASLLALNGRVEQAESMITSYDIEADTLDNVRLSEYHFSKGIIAIEKGDPKSACRHLEVVDSLYPYDYRTRYFLATAYFQDSRINDAIQLLEKMLKRYDWSRFWEPIIAAKGYYLLGTAYQEAGMKDKAIENLQTFLELWKDADPELEEVPDARKRLQALAARST